jgi:predicted DNA-binding transcriptional regulator AlpA
MHPRQYQETTADNRLLAFEQLAAQGVPWTREHIRRLVKEGKFPAPVVISWRTWPDGRTVPSRIGWRYHDIRTWREALIA